MLPLRYEVGRVWDKMIQKLDSILLAFLLAWRRYGRYSPPIVAVGLTLGLLAAGLAIGAPIWQLVVASLALGVGGYLGMWFFWAFSRWWIGWDESERIPHRVNSIVGYYRRYVPPAAGLGFLIVVMVAFLVTEESIVVAVTSGVFAGALGYGLTWLIGRILLSWTTEPLEFNVKRLQRVIIAMMLVFLSLALVTLLVPGYDEAYTKGWLFAVLVTLVPALVIVTVLRWALRRSRRERGDG